MAKKRKGGRKASVQGSTKETYSKSDDSVMYERKNIFQRIYDLSIGRVRLVAVALVLVGVALILLGGLSLFKTIRERLKNDGDNAVGEIDGGIQDGKDETESDEEKEAQEVSEEAKLARIASHNRSVKTGKWVATDYKEGDLKTGSYEVQRGDTLWEISEAVYGSGFQWHKILDANSNAVGFLPNGSQALIVPGQILAIPTK